MKKIYYAIIVFAMVIIIGVLLILNQLPSQNIDENVEPTDDQNIDRQPKSGIIETKVLQDLTPIDMEGNPIIIDKRIIAGSALAAECQETSYLEERADYVVEAGVSSINIDQTTNTKTINLGIVAWLKGKKDANSIQVLTNTAEHGESAKLEEGKIYKIYLWESGNKLYFVCEFAGVIDLGYKDWYCHETDGGRNYSEKGGNTVFFNGQIYGPYADSCSSGSILNEVVCDNDRKFILSELYLCNTSCSEGVCIIQ